MTVAQLKQHVDRRLRRKADKTDVRRLERKMDARFSQIDARFEQIDARFEHLQRTLERFNRNLNRKLDGHEGILDEFQKRLRDLEHHGV